MPTTTLNDPVLRNVRNALTALYGPVLDRVILFGSRARGKARQDSDYDIAVFLKAMTNPTAEFDRLADLRVRFLDEDGVFLDAIPFRANAYQDRTPIMHEIRHDGVVL